MSKDKGDSKSLPTPEAMSEIIERAQSGDEEALPALRNILDRVPEIRAHLGADLERTVEHSISKSLGGEANLAFREALRRKLDSIRKDLEGPNPSPTERLLVDRVVACWLQIQEADLKCSIPGVSNASRSEFHLKRQDRAHRRFLTAMKTLAMVRKMTLPVIQLNVADNQVNVANVDTSSRD